MCVSGPLHQKTEYEGERDILRVSGQVAEESPYVKVRSGSFSHEGLFLDTEEISLVIANALYSHA